MPGRNSKQAYEQYSDPILRVLGCITPDKLICKGGFHDSAPNRKSILTFATNPATIPKSGLTLFFLQEFSFVHQATEKDWKVKTHKYTYAIERADDKQEVLAFHWQDQSSKVHYPHAHMDLIHISRKAHIPTGRVPLEDVVWFLIKELDVQPLNKKWDKIILEAREKFIKFKTW